MLFHVNKHEENEMNYFQCNQCQSRFKKKERLEQHMLKKHSDFECETCGKKFPEQGSLKEHVRVCLSFKSFQNVHLFCFQVHTGERPHQCTECGATFSFQSNFISHRFEVLNTKGQKFHNVSVTDVTPAKRIEKFNNSEKKNC